MSDLFKKGGAVISADIPCRPLVICAWGAHGGYLDQDETMLGWLEEAGVEPMALKILPRGLPAHPLYLPAALNPIPYRGRDATSGGAA
jgi:hypothetical protein